MSVIRTIHDKNNPYLMVNKRTINDSTLSFKALGFWTYAMSKPDDWKFHIEHIARTRKEGKTAIYAMIRELESAGLCIKNRLFTIHESGKKLFGEIEYLFFETKEQANEFKNSLPQCGFHDVEIRDLENQPLQIKDSTEDRPIENKKLNKKKDAPPSEIACSLFSFFKASREKHLPEVKTPIPATHLQYLEQLLRLYDEGTIRKVITYGHTDPFWSKHVLTPSYLKSKFDKLMVGQKKNPAITASPLSDDNSRFRSKNTIKVGEIK